nr:hypothetical protein [Tanacetum cinerariifolium]
MLSRSNFTLPIPKLIENGFRPATLLLPHLNEPIFTSPMFLRRRMRLFLMMMRWRRRMMIITEVEYDAEKDDKDFWSTARIKTTDAGTKILATVDGKLRTISESSIRRNLKLNDEEGLNTSPDAELFENLTLMGPKSTGFTEFSSNIATAVGDGSGTPTEPHHTASPEAHQSPHHDLSSSIHPPATTETFPSTTPTELPTLRQYSKRARIAQSSALLTAADEPASLLRDDSQGEAFPTVSGLEVGQDRENIITTSALPHDSPPRQVEMALKITAQDLEISNLKARIKLLEDKDGGGAEPSGEDATIKGRSFGYRGGSKGRENEAQVVSVPLAAKVSTVGIPTGSGMVPLASPIFTTASGVTPYSRRKGKEKMVESDTPKKKKLQEQIDVHVPREMEEQLDREDQRRDVQIAKDAKIARIHAEEELQMLIDGLDRNNEIIAKYLQEYEQFAADLSIGEKIDMINELGMTLDEIREKFIPFWKKIEDFVPMASKEKGERVKRKGLRLEQESAKKGKTSKEVSEEDLKEMMHLVQGNKDYWKIIRLGRHTAVYQFFVDMLKHFDREDLTQLQTLVKETLSIRQATSDKEKELWVKLKKII